MNDEQKLTETDETTTHEPVPLPVKIILSGLVIFMLCLLGKGGLYVYRHITNPKANCSEARRYLDMAHAEAWTVRSNANRFALMNGRIEYEKFASCSAAFDYRNQLTNSFRQRWDSHACADHEYKYIPAESLKWPEVKESECDSLPPVEAQVAAPLVYMAEPVFTNANGDITYSASGLTLQPGEGITLQLRTE